jgi:hypothetical protein
MEAKYVALFLAAQLTVWARQFFAQIGLSRPLRSPLQLNHCYNQVAIAVANGSELTKHMNVEYHYARECRIALNEISVTYVKSKLNFADQFTKSLPRDSFNSQFNALSFDLIEGS